MFLKSVLTCSPLRVSLVGGGTDFASYYAQKTGAVISASIDQYVYVHIKNHNPLFEEKYRISYSEIEHCQARDEIKNGIVRASLELLNIDMPLHISTSSDLPANSGLGSSSSFAVALLLGLHEIRGEKVGAAQLAEEACQVEIDLLGSPIGKQDQYAAAFGGLNLYEFQRDHSVRIEPISTLHPIVKKLFDNIFLIWTEKSRDANKVLRDQDKRATDNSNHLDQLKSLVYELKDEICGRSSSLEKIGRIVSMGWDIKKELSPMISTPEVSEMFLKIEEHKILGSKLLGAGAGGFILVIKRDSDLNLQKVLLRDWATVSPRLDHRGARVLSATQGEA